RGDGPRKVLPERVDERASVALVHDARVDAGQRAFRVEILPRGDTIRAEARERRGELAAVAREPGLQIPVRRRAEREPLFFAIDDQPDRDALHASGTQSGLNLLPQDRR